MNSRTMVPAFAALALFAAAPGTAAAEDLLFQATTEPGKQTYPPGYLPKGAIDFRRYLGPLPRPGSVWLLEDRRMVLRLQRAPAARWQMAVRDGRRLYPRFDDAFGREIRQATMPALVHLLNRAMSDVYAIQKPAKDFFDRKRPYQTLRLKRVCGFAKPPALWATRAASPSHPSDHSAFGWTTAAILSLVAPHRTSELIARAAEYAESRVVCAAHFPSDIQAGHVMAAAIATRLRAERDFQGDLACARREYAAARPLSCFSNR